MHKRIEIWIAQARAAKAHKDRKQLNQCDGCRRGLPVNANGLHVGPAAWDLQACTADRYNKPKEKT